MFEQNKKLKFVEKQRRKRDSGDDRSDGGTYSIRSDIDEGVGVSMFSADVTTAATWGGSTEQSSTEEDSAVGEDDYPEGEVEVIFYFYYGRCHQSVKEMCLDWYFLRKFTASVLLKAYTYTEASPNGMTTGKLETRKRKTASLKSS